MGFLRNQKLQKHIDKLKQWTVEQQPLDITYPTTVHIPESIWEDIDIHTWTNTNLDTPTEKELATAIFKAPITDTRILKQRQAALTSTKHNTPILTPETEQDLKWLIHAQEMQKNYLYSMLFPNIWYMRWVKWHPLFLNAYHTYHCYINAATSLIYPMSVLLAPYWFIKKQFYPKLTFTSYAKTVFNLVRLIKQQYKSYDAYKFILGIVAYVAFYLYSLIQLVDLTIQLHLFKTLLQRKINTLCNVQEKIKHLTLLNAFEPAVMPPPLFKPSLVTLNKILHSQTLKQHVKTVLKTATLHDILVKFNQRLPPSYTLVKYSTTTTHLHHLKNPMLPSHQVSNPISLHKSIIISGPNAGGKTTYVKSFIWNMLFAQSFGIARATAATIYPADAFLHHHRVKDVTGDQSLFQAEMNKIQETLTTLKTFSNAIYFMDEPLHSTHPKDGAALLKSLLSYFTHFPNLKLVITSHYFNIHDLQDHTFVHVKANTTHSPITFDYKIYPGPSTQTIAIELLRQNKFPEAILSKAEEFRKCG